MGIKVPIRKENQVRHIARNDNGSSDNHHLLLFARLTYWPVRLDVVYIHSCTKNTPRDRDSSMCQHVRLVYLCLLSSYASGKRGSCRDYATAISYSRWSAANSSLGIMTIVQMRPSPSAYFSAQ